MSARVGDDGAARRDGNGTRLAAEAISLGYDGRMVVEDLSLRLPTRKITALVGPNGSGKSTLLRGLARLLTPLAGAVYLDGRALGRWPTRALARYLAVLPQAPPLPEGLTVRDLVWHGRYPHRSLLGGSTVEDRTAVAWALAATELDDLADRELSELSGGERQRAWIALTLAQRAEILLLDEPTTFLDVGHQLEVMELLHRLSAEHGLTVVIVLHDLNQAARYADWMVAIDRGRVWRSGTPAEVLTAELLSSVFRVRATVMTDPDGGRPMYLPRAPVARAAERDG